MNRKIFSARNSIFLFAATFVVIGLVFSNCAGQPDSAVHAGQRETVKQELIEIYYFYDEICGACLDTDYFYEVFHEAAGDVSDLYPYRLIPVNIAQTAGHSLFEQAMASFGHSTANADFPMMMINSRLFRGDDNIRNNLREAYLTAGEDIFENGYVYNSLDAPLPLSERFPVNANRDTIVYFYRIVCPECNQVKPFIDSLENVDIIRLNSRSGDNGAIVRAFFEHYNVAQADQMVPIVFLTDSYLAGYEKITALLLEQINEGKAKNFSFP